MTKDTVLPDKATAEDQNALIEFILSLFGDEHKAADFAADPERCMDDAGLSQVTPEQVHQAVSDVAQSVSAPDGGSGHWQPTYPDHGSAASILQQITNIYYQQNLTINGDNNHVDMRQVIANGDGAVAIGGDNSGPVATTGGTAGEGNAANNSSDDDTAIVDESTHGDDNSHKDNHSPLQAAPVQTFAPTPIVVDPAPAATAAIVGISGGDIMTDPQAVQPFTQVPQSVLLGDPPATGLSESHSVIDEPVDGSAAPGFLATDLDPNHAVDIGHGLDVNPGDVTPGMEVQPGLEPQAGLDVIDPGHTADPAVVAVDPVYPTEAAESYVPAPVSAPSVGADMAAAPALEFHDGA